MITAITQFMRNIKNISHFFKTKDEFHFDYHNQALIGRLSASIIHDILTPITALSISTQFDQASNKLKPIIDSSANQIKEFVDIMKDFLKENDQDTIININAEIKKSLRLITHKALQNGVQIQFIEFDQVFSRAHALHIYQIIINLVSNAIDACSESDIKKVIVILKKEKETFCIECKDFGCGIEPNDLKKICMPHFTTKTSGFGFGLYSTQFVVTQYLYGELKISSEPLSGSLFSCILPIRK